MNLLKAKPNLTKEEIYSELSSGYKNLRKGDGGRYPNEISKSLRAALFANQLFIVNNIYYIKEYRRRMGSLLLISLNLRISGNP